MSMPIINSQGTTLYAVEVPDDGWDNCEEAFVNIVDSKEIGCPQRMGPIRETRGVRRYKCITTDWSTSILGSVTRDSIKIDLLLNMDDKDGQYDLKMNFKQNKLFVLGIALPDNSRVYYFDAKVSRVATKIEQGQFITYSVTVEIMSPIMNCIGFDPNFCIREGTDGEWYGASLRDPAFGEILPDENALGQKVYEFKWRADGTMRIAFGDNGDEQIPNSHYIRILNQNGNRIVLAWDSVNGYYEGQSQVVSSPLIDDYVEGQVLCARADYIPINFIKYDMNIERG